MNTLPDIGTMLQHIQQQLPAIWRMVTGGVFMMGLFFAFRGMFLFKEYGELRVMMSSHTNIVRPLSSVITGLVLLWAVYMAQSFMVGFFSTSTPIAYSPTAGEDRNFILLVKICGDIIELIGFISFIRGWILIGHATQGGAQPGAFGRALTHIIGGVFAMNIFGTWQILKNTLGFS